MAPSVWQPSPWAPKAENRPRARGEHWYHSASSPNSADMTTGVPRKLQALLRRHPLVGRRVLDVGCGRGQYLERFPRGSLGVDRDKACVDALQARGLEAVQRDVQQAGWTTGLGRFDLVWVADILAHLQDPGAFLRSLHDVLSPGGQVVVVDWVWPRFRPLLFASWLLPGARRTYSHPEHFHRFDEGQMVALLEEAGFGVRERQVHSFRSPLLGRLLSPIWPPRTFVASAGRPQTVLPQPSRPLPRVSPKEKLRVAWTLARRPLAVHRAHHLQVVVSDRCNLACEGCFKAHPDHRPSNRDMPVERLVGLLQELRPGIVTLLGEGDPLLHPEIVSCIRRVREHRARPLLVTNLSVGDETLLRDIIDAGLTGARVTLSHSDRDRYREIKGRDLFPEVLARLQTLVGLSRPEPKVVVEFWIDRRHLGDLEEHIALVLACGVRRINFLWIRPEEQRGSMALNPEELEGLHRATRRASAAGLQTNLGELAAQGRRVSTPEGSTAARCVLPWLRAYVHVDGRMGPCVDLVSRARIDASICLPNAFDSSGQAPFAGSEFRGLRRAFRGGRAPHDPCRGCRKGQLRSLVVADRLRNR